MKPSAIIKICGIIDPELAVNAVRLNADYIGIVMDKRSKRHVNIQQAKVIADLVNNAGGIPVAVFVDTPANEILSVCEECNIKTVQLHGKISRKEHHYLPCSFQRIYAIPVNQNGIPYADTDRGLEHLDEKRDFILFDSEKSGSGTTFDWSQFKHTSKLPFIVAGGLTPNNVATAINTLHPNGVDVSSGVEKTSGLKDLKLIKKFIESAKRA